MSFNQLANFSSSLIYEHVPQIGKALIQVTLDKSVWQVSVNLNVLNG